MTEFCHFFCHSQISLMCLISFLVKSIFLYHQSHNNVFESSKKGNFWSAYTNLDYFLLLTYSCSQNSWNYQLLLIVHLKGGSFCSSVVEVLPCSGCFITCMGAHFPAVEMCKFLRFLAEYLTALAFLCCHYIFDSYITCLTLSFNTVYVYFHSH